MEPDSVRLRVTILSFFLSAGNLPFVMASLPGFGRFCMVGH